MKKFLTMLLAVLMVSALAVSASALNNAELVYSAPYGTIVVDGVIDDAWANAPWADVMNGYQSSVPGKFKVMHDDEFMYFLGQFEDTTGISSQKNENFGICIHYDNCGEVVGKNCESYEWYICNYASATNIWANYLGKNLEVGADKDYNKVVVAEGNVLTYEICIKMPDQIAEGIVGLEVILDDYSADDKWQGPRRWNTYGNDTPDEPGTLYFLPAGEVVVDPNAPVDTDPVDTEDTVVTEEPATEAVTEPVTEPVTEATEPATEEETEPVTEKQDDETTADTSKEETPKEDEKSGLGTGAIIGIIAAVVVVLAVVIVLVKKKKN